MATAGLIFGQYDEVKRGVLYAVGGLVEAAVRGDVEFASDDGLYPVGHRGSVEVYRAEQAAVVGYGH